MPPKKGKKAKKGGGTPKDSTEKISDPTKVSEVDKLQYEYELLSLDNKIKRIEEQLNHTTLQRLENEKQINDIQKEKKQVINYLNEKLRKKTDEATDLAETLEGSKQEFDLTIRKLLTEIEEESNAHKDKQEQLNAEIASYKDEITSLIHFQEIRQEVEERERKLADDVESQRRDFDHTNEILAQRERDDLLRLKRDMIRRVNESASDFRKASDAQVAPTIKRALRENQQVKLALRKLETTRNDIDEQTREYADKLENAVLKQKSLAETEIELAHQSHAKAVIITQLKKKIKEANAQLTTLELRELEIEKKGSILSDLKLQLDNQKQEICDLGKQKEDFMKNDELSVNLASKEAQLTILKSILADCASDLLKHNHLTRPRVESLMNILNDEFDINEKHLNTEVGAIEPIGTT